MARRAVKSILRLVLMVVLALLIGVALYVRNAPTDPARWHRMPDTVAPADLPDGAVRVIEGGEADLRRLHAIITATPRTRVLAGSPDQGMITYVTRSAVFGFPDYTTVRRRGGVIEIFGRLRYGVSDLGVNAERIDGWLRQLAQGG
ncbi:MAG: hypothetical protein Kow0058_15410 [Roseovarius sp.]